MKSGEQAQNEEFTPLELLTEANIDFFAPSRTKNVPTREESVFYNPVQKVNRDISVLFLKSYYSDTNRLLALSEPFCATGIRSLRYYLQTGLSFSEFIVSDIKKEAVALARKNFTLNNVERGITFECGRANVQLGKWLVENKYFDVIDIDPFGSPAPFMPTALLALSRNGILCLTATDTAVLAGVYPNKAYRRYGITTIFSRVGFIHEVALRCFIAAIQRQAMVFDYSLFPVVSFHADHYLRVFFRKENKPGQILQNTGYVSYCKRCGEIYHTSLQEKGSANSTSSRCTNCDEPFVTAGPLWTGPIADKAMIKQMVDYLPSIECADAKKTLRILQLLEDEVTNGPDLPYFHDLHVLTSQCSSEGRSVSLRKRADIMQDLTALGYRTARSHCKPTGIKTDAPLDVIKKLLE
ncbi:MAG: hypothetical protein ACFFD4_25330 [Candidatus Odinarchaeota archaeon]